MSDSDCTDRRISITIKKLKLQLARDRLAISIKASDDAQAKVDAIKLGKKDGK
jgi:hypothetical protein